MFLMSTEQMRRSLSTINQHISHNDADGRGL